MSKFFGFVFLLMIIGLIGGFIMLGFMTVEVPQESVKAETNLQDIRQSGE
ncbi:MAG: hypothetical protein ACRBCT_07555 [Alphaproteobacteria bacterium]